MRFRRANRLNLGSFCSHVLAGVAGAAPGGSEVGQGNFLVSKPSRPQLHCLLLRNLTAR